jgi:hypothetical protein
MPRVLDDYWTAPAHTCEVIMFAAATMCHIHPYTMHRTPRLKSNAMLLRNSRSTGIAFNVAHSQKRGSASEPLHDDHCHRTWATLSLLLLSITNSALEPQTPARPARGCH